MIKLCDSSNCVGCNACAQICPQNAIQLKEDSFGFLSPQIDYDHCTLCKLCQSRCPVLNQRNFNSILACYTGWAKNRKERTGSSSGAIAYILSKRIITEGGVVFACQYATNGEVEQTRIDTLDSLESARGSKYVKSATKDTYCQTRDILKKGRKVLWIGTPCQIAGLYSFLGARHDNLFTIDLICHGTPPYRYWREYLENLFPGHQVVTCSFRDNRNGYCMFFYSAGEKLQKRNWKIDPYYYAFMYGIDFNESCYSCPFASDKRVADLTIGDFWGLRKKGLGKVPLYPSLILVNNQQGKALLDVSRKDLIIIEKSVIEAMEGNAQLKHPTVRNVLRDRFLDSYRRYGFNNALKEIGICRKCQWNSFSYFFYKSNSFCKKRVI